MDVQKSKQSNEILSLIDEEQYVEAKKYMKSVDSSKELTDDEKDNIAEQVTTTLSNKIDELVEELDKDEINVDELEDIIVGYSSLQLKPVLQKLVDENVSDLIKSRKAFVRGEAFLEAEEFVNALEEFDKVIKEDSKYEDMTILKKETKDKLLNQLTIDTKNKETAKDAYLLLEEYKQYFTNHAEYDSLLEKLIASYQEETLSTIQRLQSEKKYDDAISEIELLEASNELSDELKSAKQTILAASESEKQAKLDSLLSSMNVQYDSISDITKISPAGINASSLDIPSGSFIFFPVVQFSGNDFDSIGYPVLTVVTGFSQDDWVFFEEIQFNVDGNRFNWSFGPFETNTEVGWGAIYEWASVTNLYYDDLTNQLEMLATASTIEFRYKGDTNWRDETLTSTHQQQIDNALELLNVLK